MYKIKGGDNQEYGPATADQLRAWVRENRLNRHSLAEKVGEPGWRPLGEHAEFADLFGPPSPPSLAGPTPGPSAPLPGPSAATAARAPGSDDPLQATQAPAIALLIYASLSLLAPLATMAAGPKDVSGMFASFGNLPEETRAMAERMMGWMSHYFYVQHFIDLALAALMLFGAVAMLRRTSRTWAIVAACIAVFPCTGCCCLVGIPLGIWALVVLARPEVRLAYLGK